MRSTVLAGFVLFGASSALAVACTISSTTVDGSGSDSGAGDTSTTDSGSDGGTDGDDGAAEAEAAPPPQTSVRFANLSPDAPTIDFCIAPHGTSSFQGPVIALAAADAGAGGVSGLDFEQVTTYFATAPGQYEVRLVAAGSADCSTALQGTTDATSLPSLAQDAYTTIAVLGDLAAAGNDPTLALHAYADDTTAPANQAALRFLHAAPSLPALDFGSGSLGSADFQALFTQAQFGVLGTQSSSDAGTVDTNGYVGIAPLASEEMSAHTSTGATSDAFDGANVSANVGNVITIFAVGAKTGDSSHPPVLLLCFDNAVTTDVLANCSVQ
jgi:hypothetical protein